MVTNVSIKGFEEFVKFTDNVDPKGAPVYFYFDSKLPDGTSWCPDCVVAEPIVRGFLSRVNKELIFVHVDCGPRDFYRDPQCVFRTVEMAGRPAGRGRVKRTRQLTEII